MGESITQSQPRKRVVFLLNVLDEGAIPNILMDLERPLQHFGWEAVIVALEHGETEAPTLRELTRRQIPWRILSGQKLAPWKTWAALRTVFQELAPDLIHTHLGRADLLGAVANAGKVPLVTTFHSVKKNHHPLTLLAYPFTSPWVSHRTAVSKTALESFYGSRPHPKRYSVLYNPVSRDRLVSQIPAEVLRQQWSLAPSDRLLVTVGRFIPAKGQASLIDAMALLVKQKPHLKLVLAGSGPLEASLKDQVVRLGLSNKVIFPGFARPADWFPLAELVVFPSLWEGLGLVPIEALLMGKPVVVSDIPALREFLVPGETAFFFPPGDAIAMAECLQTALDQPQVGQAMVQKGHSDMLKLFSPETIAQQLVMLYERLLFRVR